MGTAPPPAQHSNNTRAGFPAQQQQHSHPRRFIRAGQLLNAAHAERMLSKLKSSKKGKSKQAETTAAPPTMPLKQASPARSSSRDLRLQSPTTTIKQTASSSEKSPFRDDEDAASPVTLKTKKNIHALPAELASE